MWRCFWLYLLGLSLSAPVGPVNAAQIDRGIKSGFWHAWIFGVGLWLRILSICSSSILVSPSF